MSKAVLSVSEIECRYHNTVIIEGVSFSLQAGESACLLGPSGCGKTTLLRAIAGLEPIYAGSIQIHKAIASVPGNSLPPEKRNLGLVFQDHALFPHLTIEQNVGFGLRHLSRQAKQDRVQECLALVGLEGFAKRYPHQLSGGQQQRVALARTVAPKPKLILLDEPFSSLDMHLRRSLAKELKTVLKSQNIASLLVTHDQQEAFAMADYIGVMNKGKLLQWDSPYKLYHKPALPEVANFIGDGYFVDGKVIKQPENETQPCPDGAVWIDSALGQFPINCCTSSEQTSADKGYFELGCDVMLMIRPDDITPNPESKRRATIKHKVFHGAFIEYELELANKEVLKALFASHHDYSLLQDIGFDLDLQHLILYPRPDNL